MFGPSPSRSVTAQALAGPVGLVEEATVLSLPTATQRDAPGQETPNIVACAASPPSWRTVQVEADAGMAEASSTSSAAAVANVQTRPFSSPCSLIRPL